MKKNLKGAIIGTGIFGSFQAKAFSQIPYVELCGICDLNVEKAKKRNQKLGIDPEAVQKYAMQRTSNIKETTKQISTAGKANLDVNRNKKGNAGKSNVEYKPGGIAAKAHLVSRGSSGREDK